MFFTIKQPQTREQFKHYYHLRWQLLRAPWNQAEGSEIDDIEDQCLHLMAVDKNHEVIAVARLQFNSKTEAQIRYMAVARAYEKHGIGSALIKTIEEHANHSNCQYIVLDARQPAVGFYQKLGYKVVKKSYLLFSEIQHYRMVKKI